MLFSTPPNRPAASGNNIKTNMAHACAHTHTHTSASQVHAAGCDDNAYERAAAGVVEGWSLAPAPASVAVY